MVLSAGRSEDSLPVVLRAGRWLHVQTPFRHQEDRPKAIAPIRARQFGRRCAVPKAKFKGVELVRSPDEGRRLLRALHIYVFENE